MKKITTIQWIVGGIITLIIVTAIWYYTSNKQKSIPSGSGQPPVKTPSPSTPIVPPAPTAKTPYARSVTAYGATVYNKDWSKYYQANPGDPLGMVKGSQGNWTIISTSAGDKYVYTDAITVQLI